MSQLQEATQSHQITRASSGGCGGDKDKDGGDNNAGGGDNEDGGGEGGVKENNDCNTGDVDGDKDDDDEVISVSSDINVKNDKDAYGTDEEDEEEEDGGEGDEEEEEDDDEYVETKKSGKMEKDGKQFLSLFKQVHTFYYNK